MEHSSCQVPLPGARRGAQAGIEIDAERTVNEILRQYPFTIGVFGRYGVDACCGGADTLRQSAALEGVDLDALLDDLRRAAEAER